MNTTLERALGVIAVLAGVILGSFLLLQWLPGDPAQLYAGEEATDEEVALIRRKMGLDQPVWIQLGRHAMRLLQGDLGLSLRSGRPVREELAPRLAVTASLAAGAAVIGVAFAVPAALIVNAHPGGFVSRAIDWVSLSVLSLPVYWLGLGLILIFGVRLGWFVPEGTGRWHEYILPAIALGAHTGAATARVLAASISDVLGAAYVRTALGKGLSSKDAMVRHVLPNALIPAVTYFSMEIGKLFGGAVLTESVFSLNGLGRYLVLSIAFRDYPAVVGATVIVAVGVTLANAAADALCRWLDPRARDRG